MKLKELLKYRNIWTGFAMLMILWYHSKLNFPIAPVALLKDISYGGVDLIIFTSGVGCYYSLLRQSDAYEFMKRRAGRIMPGYFLFILFWLAFRMAFDPISPRAVLGNILSVQYLTGLGEHFNWYIPGIMLLYLTAPVLMGLIGQYRGRGRWFIAALLLLATVPFWNSSTNIVIVMRLPVFFLGLVFADACHEDQKLDRKNAALIVGGLLLGLLLLVLVHVSFGEDKLWDWGMYWYPYFFIVPGLCTALSLLCDALDKCAPGRWIVSALNKIGQYSFELYLVHLLVFEITYYLINTGRISNSIFIWFAAIAVSGLLCPVLRLGVDKIKKLVPSKKAA